MAKTRKVKPREISALQDQYLAKREELLSKKVDALSVKLFDRVYDSYLVTLLHEGGKIVATDQNYNLVKGLDAIYRQFTLQDNVPVVKSFVEDLQGITPLNERYFKSLTHKDVKATAQRVAQVVDKRLGLEPNGQPRPGGFVDKFINDQQLLKKIRKTTNQAITQGIGFQELRTNLKELIQGNPKVPQSGGLQQYYRNYAYDTFTKVDRLNADLFAKDLALRYFYWTGGLIPTSRAICEKCNGMILDGNKWNEVTDFTQLKEKYRDGMDKDSVPRDDLGGYGCRHRKRYVLDSVALQTPGKILNVDDLLD